MTTHVDLKKFEKKVWQFQFSDGSLEFLFGMILVIGAIRTLTDQVYYTGLIIAGLVVFIVYKYRVALPRLGRVEYGKIRMSRQRWAGLAFAVVLVGMMMLFALSTTGIFLDDLSHLIIVAFIVMVFAAVAFFIDYWKFLVIGAAFGAREIIWQVYGATSASYFAIAAGSIILVAGIWQFTCFMKRYPKQDPEVSDA